MTDTNAVIATYDDHLAAENAVKELQRSGFDIKKLSVVGRDYHTDEQVVGYYNAGDRMQYWVSGALSGEGCGAYCLAPHSFGSLQ